MLRIVFTAEDLARIRVASKPDPLWESVLSLHQLADRRAAVGGPYAHWVDWVRTVARDRVTRPARVLHDVAPAVPYFPDFLTPAEGSQGLEPGVDAILHTPRRRLRAELALAGSRRPMPAWTADLAAGRRLDWLADAFRGYHKHAIAPFEDRIAAYVDAHRARLTARLATDGVEAALGAMSGAIRWDGPELVADYPVDHTLELGGRGLTLVPSFFCRRHPIGLADPELEPVLVYPIDPPVGWMQPPRTAAGVDKGLTALVGGPRARLLRALEHPAGTGRLSTLAQVPLSSTSEHVAILRNAGLVESVRQGREVVHSLTPLGRSLLSGDHQ
jgi:DNA-binding transcriptional ArsR family regulator